MRTGVDDVGPVRPVRGRGRGVGVKYESSFRAGRNRCSGAVFSV